MTRIKVPRTLTEAQAELGSLGELLTATEWHRAAILATFVRLSEGRGGDQRSTNARSSIETSPSEFAALGIAGLRSKDTVRLYVQRWLDAHNGEHPAPGSRIDLPTAEWSATRTGTNGANSEDGARRTVERMVETHGAEAVARIVAEAAPEATAQAVADVAPEVTGEAVAARPAARNAANRAQARNLPPAPFTHPPQVGNAADEASMDADALIAQFASFRGRMLRAIQDHPSVWAEKADRLAREVDRFSALPDLARGIVLTDEDLAAFIDGSV